MKDDFEKYAVAVMLLALFAVVLVMPVSAHAGGAIGQGFFVQSEDLTMDLR